MDTEGFTYFHLVGYHPFADVNFALEYREWVGNKIALKGMLGGGFYKFPQLGVGISYSNNGVLQHNMALDYESDNKNYLLAKIGMDYVLKNDDLLGVSIGYEHFFSPIFQGGYNVYSFTSSGSILNRGNNLNLTLGYQFTRAKRMKKIEEYFLKNKTTVADAKKAFKAEKRYIDPESWFVSISGGLFLAKNKASREATYLNSISVPSYIVQLSGEKGIRDNYFMEFGVSVSESFSAIHVNEIEAVRFTIGYNEFVGIQPSFGIGKRLIGKNNTNYLNISAGVSVGINTDSKESVGAGSGNLYSEIGDTLYAYTYDDGTKSPVYPTLYFDLNKGFQMTNNLYLSLSYRHNIGFIPTWQADFEYHSRPDLNTTRPGSLKINGTSNAFQLGLKYKFVPKRKD